MSVASWFEHRAGEVRHAVRMIRRTPTASAVAVLSLALGIGANTAIFSIVDALLLRTLPVRAPHELHQVARQLRERPSVTWNYPDYCAYRDRVRAFDGLIAYSSSQPVGMQVADEPAGGAAEIAYASMVSGNYFVTLGVGPAAGQLLNAADDRRLGASPYAVLGHAFWQRRFAGDPRVVGRVLRVNGYPFTIVGVVTGTFRGLDVTASPDLYLPITMRTEVHGVPAGVWNTRHYWWIQVVGRLAAGQTGAKARAELATVFRDQEEAERRANPSDRPASQPPPVLLLPAAHGYSSVRNTLEKPLTVLMVVVGLVLLIACANVANLMMARTIARRREIAVRLSVGATRWRVASQILVESLTLSLAGGAAGLAFAYLCVQALLQFLPRMGGLQVNFHVSPDLRVLAFTVVASVLTGTLFGLAPALHATRTDPGRALKSGAGEGRHDRLGLRRLLVVTQVALSLLLLVGAVLFVRSLQNLQRVDVGFRREQAIVVSVDPSRNGYKGQRLRDFYERLRAEAARLPGVRSSSLAVITPLAGSRWNGDVAFEGYTWKAGEQRWVDLNPVSARYFETAGIPLVLGRDFVDSDNPPTSPDPPETIGGRGGPPPMPGPRVAIITESIAKRFFAGRNPIGLHLCLDEQYDATRAYEIVGVVKDARYFGLREAAEPMVYLPSWSLGAPAMGLCVRSSAEAPGLIETLRRRVTALDPAVPVLRARSLKQEVDNQVVVEELIATLCSFFGLLALLLAGIGLYGVLAYAVSGRTREIGIRMALGAPRTSVLWLVLRDAGLLVLAGLGLGAPLALWLSRLVKTFLFGVEGRDPLVVAVAILMLVAAAVAACLVPARRATAVEPTTALRCE